MDKISEAKKKILAAALEEFGKKGYQNASTNQIKDRADVSKGLIFKHFSNKSMLFYEVFSQALVRLKEAIDTVQLDYNTPIYERLLEIVLFKVAYAKKNPYDTAILLEAFRSPQEEWQDKMKDLIVVMTKMSLEHIITQEDMNAFSSRFTKEDVIRNITLATSGLQEMYVNESLSLEYLENVREEAFMFLKIVIEGMKDR